MLWSKEFIVHHDIDVPKISFVNLEKPEFDNWHVHHVEPLPGYGISPIQTPVSGASSTTSTTSLTELQNFRKGVEQDTAAYDVFKDLRCNDNFLRSLTVTARAQGLSHICDPNFKSNWHDLHEQHLFNEQQDFMFLV